MLWLETACKAQVDTLAMGREIVIPDEAVRNRTARLYDPDVRALGPLEWDAMLRLLVNLRTERVESNHRADTLLPIQIVILTVKKDFNLMCRFVLPRSVIIGAVILL